MSIQKKNLLLTALVAGLVGAASCATAETNMVHRWSFNETSGTTVADSIGGKNGTLMQIKTNSVAVGALPALNGAEVTLDGLGGYVDLGNGIFSGLTNMTIEVWFRFIDNSANADWANLLCAGSITNTTAAGQGELEDTDGSLRNANGGNYLGTEEFFLVPRNGANGNARFAITDNPLAGYNGERTQLNSVDPLENDTDLGGALMQLAVTYGPDGARLFKWGDEQASQALTNMIPLSAMKDVNIWLGRSLYGGDPMLNCAIAELRVHDTILTGPELTASYYAGAIDPDIVDYNPGSLSALDGSTTINPFMSQTQTQPLRVLATYSLLGAIPIGSADLDFAYVTDTNILEIVNGSILAKVDGSSTVWFGLDGISNSVAITVNTTPPVLAHRYSFSETSGTTLADSEGGANASLVMLTNTATQVSGGGGSALGGGQLRMYGGGRETSDYVELPSNIIHTSQLTNLTFEAWITPHTAQNWSRVLSFGTNTANVMFLSLDIGTDINRQRFNHVGGFAPPDTTVATALNQKYHYVVEYGGGRAAWYRDGVLISEATGLTTGPMDIADTFNWLGRSQWPDATSDMSIDEVRLWNGTLLPLNIALNAAAGPDSIPSDPGNLLSIAVDSQDLMLGNPNPTPACLCGTFQNISGVNLITLGGSLSSGDTSVITVDANGNLTGVGTNGQSATISGTYYSESVTPLLVNVYAPTSLVMNLTGSLVAGGLSVSASLEADFPSPALQDQDVTAFDGVVFSSSNPGAASISDAGLVTPNGPGVAEIVATYGGLSATGVVSVTVAPGHTAPTLKNRYSFSEAPDSTTVVDSVSGANGEVRGISAGSPTDNFNGTGQLITSGGGDSLTPLSAYVNLPNGLVSGLSAVTMEGWLTDIGAQNWERWFDFGMSSGAINTNTVPTSYGEDAVANPGRAYFFLARPGTGTDLRFAYKQAENGETGATAAGAIVDSNYNHFAVVVDPPNGVASLYLNGVRVSQTPATLPLSVIDDRNNWLGRSQWGDGMFGGIYDEFRIWDGALLGADIQAAFAAGPGTVIDPIAGTTAPELTITPALPNVIISWPVSATGFNLEVAADVDGPYGTDGLPAPTVVGDQNQVTVPASALSQYFRLSDQ